MKIYKVIVAFYDLECDRAFRKADSLLYFEDDSRAKELLKKGLIEPLNVLEIKKKEEVEKKDTKTKKSK